MPRFPLTPAQISDIATFLHSFRVNGYDEARQRPPSIVVGNATAGEAYFKNRCASCHSVTGDLQGFATRTGNPRTLQQSWLMPGSGGRGAPPPANAKPPRATVTAGTEKVEGEIERLTTSPCRSVWTTAPGGPGASSTGIRASRSPINCKRIVTC